jgi:hypothetical protein
MTHIIPLTIAGVLAKPVRSRGGRETRDERCGNVFNKEDEIERFYR